MLALLGHAYAAAGHRREAEAILDELTAASSRTYVSAYPLAIVDVALGRKDEAFALLEKAYTNRDSWLNYVAIDPRLDVLHSDPRFVDLLRRLNLGAQS
jgi:hypothetical protein